ncbi:hypothetical protein D4R75_10535 [bacterium]|nr:MAG: hypothetical protein D4R75_10535 [bacterium]
MGRPIRIVNCELPIVNSGGLVHLARLKPLLDEALIRQWGFIRLHAVAPELPEVVRRGSLCSIARWM